MFGAKKKPGSSDLTPGHMACLHVLVHQHRFARREQSLLIAVAILRARELSIRQHIMLFTVIVIELYIFHASFRVDVASIIILTYYVNRLFDILFWFIRFWSENA